MSERVSPQRQMKGERKGGNGRLQSSLFFLFRLQLLNSGLFLDEFSL
jgi:hypothetical protein